MSKAVADLIATLPGATFDNTGGGCMAIVWPTGGNGAIAITGTFGRHGYDNFTRHDEDATHVNHDLTGFFAAYHAEWFGEDPQDVDPVIVYESADFDAESETGSDDYDAITAANMAKANAEISAVVAAMRAFIHGQSTQTPTAPAEAPAETPGQTATGPVVLPSGSTISRDTWDTMKAAGDWRGWVSDERMYSDADAAFLDDEIGE